MKIVCDVKACMAGQYLQQFHREFARKSRRIAVFSNP
jgi:hypothetical protein